MDKENIVKQTCKELGITQKELSEIRTDILEGFLVYQKEDMDSISFSKKESKDILEKLKKINKYKYDGDFVLLTRELLSDKVSISSCGNAIIMLLLKNDKFLDRMAI